MIREKLILDNNIFIADYYNSDIDKRYNHYSNFVFIRNYNILNEIFYDKDIYFIETSLYYDLVNNMKNNKTKFTDDIVYPLVNNNAPYYSNNYELFNGLFVDDSLYSIDNGKIKLGEDVYELYGKNEETNEYYIKSIKCNVIRLYRPHNIDKEFNGIIHISNFINGINYHYLCRPYNSYSTKLETEFKVDNIIYSEYIELFIPNISDLFSDNVYFKDNLNFTAHTDERNYKLLNKYTIVHNDDLYVNFSLLLYPFSIEYNEKTGLYTKLFFKSNENKLINKSTLYPINLSLLSFENINNATYLYKVNKTGTCVFVNDNTVELVNKLSFNEDGKICVKIDVLYKNLIIEDNNTFETYCKYYNINVDEYIDYKKNIINNLILNFCEEYGYNSNEIEYPIISKEPNKPSLMFNTFIKESEEEIKSAIDFIGYSMILSTDLHGNNIIFEHYSPLDISSNKINKEIILYNIFNKWIELPETLYITITFIDRYIGNVIKGNRLTISKEWFKYIIADTNIYKFKELENISKEMETITLDTNNINFINNINCVIKKDDNKQDIKRGNNAPRIIYKPFFYKTQDLQQMYLRTKLIQNIGINLSEYMTKVDTFKLSIENLIYTEIGRNDAYVIFRVNAAEIVNTLGRYDIFNQDDQYISSGTYNLY